MEHKTTRVRPRIPIWAVLVVVAAVAAGGAIGFVMFRPDAPATPQAAFEQALDSAGSGLVSRKSEASPDAPAGSVCRVNAVLRADAEAWKTALTALRAAAEHAPDCIAALTKPGSDPSQPALLVQGSDLLRYSDEQLRDAGTVLAEHTVVVSLKPEPGSTGAPTPSILVRGDEAASFAALANDVQSFAKQLPTSFDAAVWFTPVTVTGTGLPSTGSVAFLASRVQDAVSSLGDAERIAEAFPQQGVNIALSYTQREGSGFSTLSVYDLPSALRADPSAAKPTDAIGYDALTAEQQADADAAAAKVTSTPFAGQFRFFVYDKEIPR